jgi:hypothetical protein
MTTAIVGEVLMPPLASAYLEDLVLPATWCPIPPALHPPGRNSMPRPWHGLTGSTCRKTRSSEIGWPRRWRVTWRVGLCRTAARLRGCRSPPIT